MNMKKSGKILKAKSAINIIRVSVDVRNIISGLYKSYNDMAALACQSSFVSRSDFKRAVDALYYLGGGWPTQESKGRMEAMLDNFVGMYRILDFIGSGHLVDEHLKQYGIKISMDPEFAIENHSLTDNEKVYLKSKFKSDVLGVNDLSDIRSLVTATIMECQDLQGQICVLADKIKLELRPAAQEELQVENEEYERLFDIVKTSTKKTDRAEESIIQKKDKISKSISQFNLGVSSI